MNFHLLKPLEQVLLNRLGLIKLLFESNNFLVERVNLNLQVPPESHALFQLSIQSIDPAISIDAFFLLGTELTLQTCFGRSNLANDILQLVVLLAEAVNLVIKFFEFRDSSFLGLNLGTRRGKVSIPSLKLFLEIRNSLVVNIIIAYLQFLGVSKLYFE